ncbi:MAG: hypothetical protein Q8R58_06940 [Sulfuricurvum sp.]|jgi:hypothetical protein|nr:hypothetical protein [Sulfuricurvum sp.]MDP3587767.1 hypothetical protein [Sulfuricurvum sp.]
MQLKRYTIASFIFIFLVGIATYSIDNDAISFDLLGIHFPNLPIAFWVAVPVALMYFVSVLHMAFHALLGNLKLRKLDRDNEKMIDALRDGLLGVSERNYVFKTDAYRLMGKLLDNSLILPYESLREVGNEKIDEALALLRDVKDKKKVDIKKFHLGNSTSIAIENNLNRLERGELAADEVLSRSDTYGSIVASKAYESYVKTASLGSVLKYKQFFKQSSLIDFVQRINNAQNGIEMSNEELISLLKSLKLTTEDYINLSIAMAKNMVPEQRIRLFETLSETNDDAMEGYFYTLYDLQMVDTANEILNNTSKDDYLIFKAYRDLKRANKHYDIALFLRK